MKPLLVDTSVWVDYFNGIISKETEYLYECIIKDYPVCVCPMIIQELLQGFKNDKDYHLAKESLLELIILVADPIEAAIGAANIYRKARKNGITIRKSNDCMIAYYAMLHKVPVLQKDRDFPQLAKITEIKIVNIT